MVVIVGLDLNACVLFLGEKTVKVVLPEWLLCVRKYIRVDES